MDFALKLMALAFGLGFLVKFLWVVYFLAVNGSPPESPSDRNMSGWGTGDE